MLPARVVASHEMLLVRMNVNMVSPPTGRPHEAKDDAYNKSELTNAIRSRYRASSGEAKRRILEEFIAATGYHEKSALRVLTSFPTVRGRQTRLRSSIYDEAARAALIRCGRPRIEVCGKRLKALVPILLPGTGARRPSQAQPGDSHKSPIDECSDDGPSVANTL